MLAIFTLFLEYESEKTNEHVAFMCRVQLITIIDYGDKCFDDIG